MFAPPPLPRTFEAAVRDAGSVKPDTRVSAIADLTRHGSLGDVARGRAMRLLVELLRSDPEPKVRSAAAVALGDLAADEMLPALLVAVEDDDAHVRQMALNALGEIGDVRAAPRLRRALSDERPEVRYQAIIAYVRICKADAAETDRALLAALRDSDESIRYIAVRLTEERVEAGSRPGAPLAARLRELAHEPQRAVAVAAAIALAKAGAETNRPLLLRVVRGELTEGPLDDEDEREAVELCGELGLREAIPALERRAFGLARWVRDTCAWQAKVALARLGHARAIDEIARDLGSTNPTTRAAAVVAAGRARLDGLRGHVEAQRGGPVDAELVDEALARLAQAWTSRPPSAT